MPCIASQRTLALTTVSFYRHAGPDGMAFLVMTKCDRLVNKQAAIESMVACREFSAELALIF